MTSKQQPLTRVAAGEADPDQELGERLQRIRERPDGYHWIDLAGRQEFGPFESLAAALAAMDDNEAGLEAEIAQDALTAQAEADLEIGRRREPRDEDDPADAS